MSRERVLDGHLHFVVIDIPGTIFTLVVEYRDVKVIQVFKFSGKRLAGRESNGRGREGSLRLGIVGAFATLACSRVQELRL